MTRTPVYLVAMPIGDHMDDLSVAAVRLFPELEDIFVEPDDVGLERLRRHKLITDRHRVHHTDTGRERARELLDTGRAFAIVASSGLPGFVDPGHEIVDEVLERYADRVELVPIGVSSALDAGLCASGVDIQRFVFVGHFPECYRFDADVVRLGLPLVAFVRGSAVRRWVETVDAGVPGMRRHLLLKDVRKKLRSRMWVIRPGEGPPDSLVDESGADYVAVVAVGERHAPASWLRRVVQRLRR